MRKTVYLTRYIMPQAVGYLIAEDIRCGKPGCACGRGKKHGPYWYLHFRRLESGVWRARKWYVPAARAAAVRRSLARAKAQDRAALALLGQAQRLRAAVHARRRGRITDADLKGLCDGIIGNDAGKG